MDTLRIFRRLADPNSAPVITKLPADYAYGPNEADMEDEIERLRKYIASCEFDMQEYGGFSDHDIAQRRSSHLEPGDLESDD